MFPELVRRCAPELTDSQIARLDWHYGLLLRWNKVLNLTRITETADIVARHYCESLFVGQVLRPEPQTIVDIGSGAGFPGFPVAVLRPDCTVTLVEAHRRKAVFLKEATRGMSNVRVFAGRAEDLAEQFDWAMSRAISYEDLGSALKRLAARAALLTGSDAPPNGLGFEWQPAMPMPGGSHRFLRVGMLQRG